MKMLIRINAHSCFTHQNRHLAEQGQLPEEDAPENHGPIAAGSFAETNTSTETTVVTRLHLCEDVDMGMAVVLAVVVVVVMS